MDLVRDGKNCRDLVSGDEDGAPIGREFADDGPDFLGVAGRDSHERLVRHKAGGPAHEGEPEFGAPSLAPGQPLGWPVQPWTQAQATNHLAGVRIRVPAKQQLDVVAQRPAPRKQVPLGNEEQAGLRDELLSRGYTLQTLAGERVADPVATWRTPLWCHA